MSDKNKEFGISKEEALAMLADIQERRRKILEVGKMEIIRKCGHKEGIKVTRRSFVLFGPAFPIAIQALKNSDCEACSKK